MQLGSIPMTSFLPALSLVIVFGGHLYNEMVGLGLTHESLLGGGGWNSVPDTRQSWGRHPKVQQAGT